MIRWAAALALLFSLAGAARAEPVTDCPHARARLGLRAPLMDVLLHPGGPAALDSVSPGLVEGFTRNFGGHGLPKGFAAILTPATLLEVRPDGAALAPAMDAKLAALPVDEAFVKARCARYDHDRPTLPPPDGRPALLVFEKINGFRDEPSVAAAHRRLAAIAAERGWQIVFSDRGGVMNPQDLRRFKAVVWNNVSGDVLTAPQRAAFRAYVEQGGGYVGIHGSGGDPAWFWDWYVDGLVGARFIGHPASPQFQSATVRLRDRGLDPALPPAWTMTEEWYSFDHDPAKDGAVIVATIDEADYQPVGFGGRDLRMGIHPIAWRKTIGRGRSFYSAIGHRPENYDQPEAARLLAAGIGWAMGPR